MKLLLFMFLFQAMSISSFAQQVYKLQARAEGVNAAKCKAQISYNSNELKIYTTDQVEWLAFTETQTCEAQNCLRGPVFGCSYSYCVWSQIQFKAITVTSSRIELEVSSQPRFANQTMRCIYTRSN